MSFRNQGIHDHFGTISAYGGVFDTLVLKGNPSYLSESPVSIGYPRYQLETINFDILRIISGLEKFGKYLDDPGIFEKFLEEFFEHKF